MTENRTNIVDNLGSHPPHEVLSDGLHPKLLLSQSNRLPTEEELTILRGQLVEDMNQLAGLCSRIDRERAKIQEKIRAMEELKSELETAKIQHDETSRQVTIERDVQSSIERISREYANAVVPSAFAADFQRINSESVEKSRAVFIKSIHVSQEAQEQKSARISHLEISVGLAHASLNLLFDRQAALEKHHSELQASVQSKRARLGPIRVFPTELLVHIFLCTVETVIRDRIRDQSRAPRHPTLAIASVCRRWRHIAINTVDLWRYIPIYGHPPLDAYLLLPMPTRLVFERGKNSRDLFVDWTPLANAHSERPMSRWADMLKSMALPVTDAKLDPQTSLTLFFAGESAMSLRVQFFILKIFVFHNVYPEFNRASAQHVNSIIMHFRDRPKLKKVLDTLRQFPNLIKFELYFEGRPHRSIPPAVQYPSHPRLKSLSLRLSMVPFFFDGGRSVSTMVDSLKIGFDVPVNVTFLHPVAWVATVESSGLAMSLRRLELYGSISSADTSTYLAPLLSGLSNVVTLALHGGFMTPILDTLSHSTTLLPAFHRLEMHDTDINQSAIEQLLNSRRRQPGPAPVSEMVINHCSNITHDFCDRIRENVDSLVVYC